MAILERVPFEVAINAPKLLKPRFDTLSKPQQVVLKAFYGLNLSEEELFWWSVFQGGAEYDELGYVTGVTLVPYTPREYSRLVAVLGRRSGKTDYIVGTAVSYEITLGGHHQYVRQGQEYKALFFAQSKTDAQTNMQFIRMALEESPLLSKELMQPQVVSEIRLKDGLVVQPVPVGITIGRGHAVPVVIMDEAAFWYTDPDAANPDFEVLRAVSYSQLQFPNAKIFIPSTPWAEQGILWQAFKAGTQGMKLRCEKCKRDKEILCTHQVDQRLKFSNTLVVHASTAAMQSLDCVLRSKEAAKRRLVEIKNDDPEIFPRESLALFIKSISGWLNKENIAKAIASGVYLRPAVRGENAPQYVAIIDPAFRKDSFAMTILHHDLKVGLVQDFIRFWRPEPGKALKPGEVLDELKLILTEYGLNSCYSDQHQLESLQQLALDRGFIINGFDITGPSKSKMTGSFKILLDQGRVTLLDHDVQKDQLECLQQEILQSNYSRIAAPPGKHDDLAMALMLGVKMVLWLISGDKQKKPKSKTLDKDHVTIGMEQITRNRRKLREQLEDY